MDFAYSPHREGLHLPSPTHHAYRMEGAHFSSLQELRRSLSRSPSKPSRFQLRTGKTETPGSPLSPLALARAFSPKSSHQPQSPVNTFSDSLFGSQSTKKKFTIRRSGPFRSSPRNRNKSKSPRRVLVDSTDLGNSTPVSRSLFGEENNTPARKPVAESPETHDNMRLDFNDAPIKPLKFGLSRPNVPSNFFATNQASPLKRRDGISGFDSASVETPNPKRRSVHAETSFNIFETPMSRPATEDFDFNRPQESEPTNLFATPVTQSQTPFKRTGSVRRPSAPRTSTSSPRPKTVYDGEFVVPGIAASKNKPRTSIDGRVRADSSQMRHPLANAVTASPSTPIFNDNSTSYTPAPVKTIFHDNSTSYTPAPVKTIFHDNSTSFTPAPVRTVMRSNCLFGKSLPIGAARPLETGTDEVFATPAALKQVRQNAAPIPQSTGGLLSKKHRDIGLETLEYKAPDTPIKLHRQSYPPAAETPTSNRRSHSMKPLQQPVFGTASTPFSVTASTPFNATQTMNEGSNFFTRMSGMRRRSFVDIDGDDDCNHSPTGNKHMTGSQSSADDGPPTPTKSSNSNSHGRKSKDNSLRRKTFAYSRGSLSNVFPESGSPSINIPAPLDFGSSVSATPHTPSEPCMPPDPSFLSISGSRRESFSFNSSLDSNPFPPATPTGPRGSIGFFGQSQTISLTDNDVDESLAARFRAVQKLDGTEGEFSQVFKVSRPIKEGVVHSSPPGSRFWVVKKSKKPLLGAKDSEQKQREVQALKAVRGHEHIVLFEDSWVDHGHLYIQTEYCEEGNLRQFIDKYGRAGCLDNFRTWKILLELSSGLNFIHESGYMHLDLKPANVLIDFEGVLKIADFGMAVQWPAPKNIDAEGDRHYLAREAMYGSPCQPSDVFALGLMMVEICSNCYMPEMGDDWTRLRSGNFVDVPSLTWSEDSTLLRDSEGLPISQESSDPTESDMMDHSEHSFPSSVSVVTGIDEAKEFAKAPDFMKDRFSPYSMDLTVQAMLSEHPHQRPTADEVNRSFGCQWVNHRRRAGATIYEGNFGPDFEVLASYEEHPDAMDTS